VVVVEEDVGVVSHCCSLAGRAGWLEAAAGSEVGPGRRPPLSYGPPWAHYLGGYQDRLLGGPLGLPDLCRTIPDGVRHKDSGG
jgi:hypothetical protein